MPSAMRAVVLHSPGQLSVETVPVPELLPGQKLVKVGACGICGSDLRYFAGENPWAKHTLGTEKPNPPDMILGHELGGWADVEGARRAVGCLAFRGCGRCAACRRGEVQLCADTAHLGHGAGWEGQNPGGMAECCPVWSEGLYRLPEHLTVDQATFLDGLGVAVHAARLAALFPGEPILLLGGGPIGLLIGQAARALGAGAALVADVYETPLDCAGELGLGPTINVSSAAADDLAAAVREFAPEGVQAVFDTTGDIQSQRVGLGLLRRGGTIVLMAGAAPGLSFHPRDLAGERRLMTCSNNRYEDFTIGLSLMAEAKVIVEPMITHRFPLEEAAQAFAVATDKVRTGALKVILQP